MELQWIWDDDQYVYANPVLNDAEALSQIWFNVDATPQYYPVVFTVFWAISQLVGTDPQLYHLLNIALHACNACLLCLCLNRIQLKASFWIALCFALHPIQVETVAWVTELKNLLSTAFFGIAWLLIWPILATDELSSQETMNGGSKSTALRYASGLVVFMAALLSKSVTASLPAALLVVIWFKHHRITKAQVLALVPFFCMGAFFGLRTASLERVKVGAMGAEWDYGVLERVGIVSRSLWHYALSLTVPLEQMFFYPRFETQFGIHAAIALTFGIAYAWVTKGFFSAFLHMVCVIMAGAVAFAFWEHSSLLILTKAPSGFFGFVGDAAWGLGLIFPFALSLIIFRVIADSVVKANVQVAEAMNYIGGGVCGLVSGVITAGVFVIAVGYMRVPAEFLGYQPVGYANQGNLVRQSSLWLPV
ncbi:MAG: hypothetical protein AAGG44_15980, partial [Planctomycetota bacterium]